MGKQNSLGRCLQKNKTNRIKQMKQMRSHNAKTNDWVMKQHMPPEEIIETEYKPKSVVQQDLIEEMFDRQEIIQPFVCNSQESGNEKNFRIIHCGETKQNEQLKESQIEIMDHLNKSIEQMPIRPTWIDRSITSMTNIELDTLEKEVFFKWRKNIHAFQTNTNISLTPYEKSLNVWRQLWHVVENSDLVCQIVDARDPLLFYCATIKSILENYFENKRMIVLLNKADLLTENQRSCWWEYFNNAGIEVYFWSAIADVDNSAKVITSNEDIENYTDNYKICNQSELLKIFEDYALEKHSDVYAIGMIGFPNVGKSSTLNQILQSKKAAVSATPGKTKHFQTFMLNKSIKLIDCPGLVFPTFVNSLSHMILAGVLPIDNIRDLSHAMQLMVSRIPQHVFEYTYKIKIPTTKVRDLPDYCSSEELLSSFSVMRGLLTSCGVGNLSEGSKILLKDYINGKLIYVQPPSNVDSSDFNNYSQIKEILTQNDERHSQSYKDQMHSKIIKMSNMVDETNMELKFQQKIRKQMAMNNLSDSTNDASFIDVTNKHWRKQAKKRKGKLRRKYKDIEGTPYDE